MPKKHINAVDIHYYQKGQGPDLVLIPGYTVNTSIWHKIEDRLAQHFRLLIFDNRDAGLSGRTEHTYPISTISNDIVMLMESLDINEAHILGHSMGGKIAQQFALDHPHKVDKLILLASTYRNASLTLHIDKINMMLAAQGVPLEQLFKVFALFLYAKAFLDNEQSYQQEIQRLLEVAPLSTAKDKHHHKQALSNFNTEQQLANIQANTLVITGKEDILILPQESHTLAEKIPKASLATIESCGHMPPIEKPLQLCELIEKFLLGHH